MQHNLHIMQLKQRGVAAVEFALIAPLFFAFLFGVIEMGRVLYYMNAATEATRLGVRLAVVCDIDINNTAIVTRMQGMLPFLEVADVSVVYRDKDGNTGCGQADCETVTVSINDGLTMNTLVPFFPFSVTLPTFTSTLPRESLSSTYNSSCD